MRYWSSPIHCFPIQLNLVKTGTYLLFCSAQWLRLKDTLDQITRFETEKLCIQQPIQSNSMRILIKVRRLFCTQRRKSAMKSKGANGREGNKVLKFISLICVHRSLKSHTNTKSIFQNVISLLRINTLNSRNIK